ncbi:MAG: hypothetical protein KDM64_15320, partial [Verrucomicrobiae bacterium]|nr:hypothetical protein [Verrucomicrobiae bacterium]
LAKRLATAPALPIPALTAPEIARLPERTKKGSPSHASVIHGIDPAAGTIAYLEPWGGESLERHMRIEEMAATTYAVFYYGP